MGKPTSNNLTEFETLLLNQENISAAQLEQSIVSSQKSIWQRLNKAPQNSIVNSRWFLFSFLALVVLSVGSLVYVSYSKVEQTQVIGSIDNTFQAIYAVTNDNLLDNWDFLETELLNISFN